ncbi:Hypothetical predicted protein [Olea europaea subsp. europaea]|uniref:Uncharacterized protein n=1 Tax=Olea europaea subsp. europaea TaxID=158383 RepID=A0A8S0R3E4_OLEEU|nr:Hypothetical predicted protein [Olea europaea subsp. europaea]
MWRSARVRRFQVVSLFGRFSISHSPFFGIHRRMKKHSGITRSSISSNGGGVIIEKKEFEFKPLFGDYLKAMENVKIDRDGNNRSSNSLRKKKHFKGKEKEEGEGNTKFVDSGDNEIGFGGWVMR